MKNVLFVTVYHTHQPFHCFLLWAASFQSPFPSLSSQNFGYPRAPTDCSRRQGKMEKEWNLEVQKEGPDLGCRSPDNMKGDSQDNATMAGKSTLTSKN